MINFVKHLSSVIEGGRRIIKVLRKGKSDVQTAFECAPWGTDGHAPANIRAIYAKSGTKKGKVVIGYINTSQIADVGEHRNYSTDADGNVVFEIFLRNDGTAEIGGVSDNMVRYSKLEEAFNELKSDHNALVTAHNTHIHVTTATIGLGPAVGVLSITAAPEDPSTADISPAKIDEIKTS